MHPLLDRRDLTRARDQAAAGNDRGPGELERELGALVALLRELLTQERSEVQELCVSDREPPEARMDNFPLPGATRLIVRRPGAGGTYTLGIATPLPILAANENRLGGRITADPANTTPVVLYLAADLLTPASGNPLTVAAATVRLPPGGAWDLKLGDALWCGSLTAVAAAAATVSVAEV